MGRYTCAECIAAGRRADPPVGAATAPNADDDGTLALMDDPPPADPRKCPNCAGPLEPGVLICMTCGYNRATGRSIRTEVGFGKPPPRKPRKKFAPVKFVCKQCGYDLAGLKGMTCPECGTVNRVPQRREREVEESRRIVRRAWLAPVVMIAGGLGGSCLLLVVSTGAAAIPFHLLDFAVSLVVGLGVYLVCSVLWLGFDEPLPMTALRLAGVYALASIPFQLFLFYSVLPLGFLTTGMIAAPLLIYVGLLTRVMDIEYEDAVIVSIITTAARIFLVPVLVDFIVGLL